MKTPFEAWYGRPPDLSHLRLFGSRVCVRRTGRRRAKLDRHDFTGLFLGFTVTDQNIRYLDINTGIVKTSHHAPAAQLLYDMGLSTSYDEEMVRHTRTVSSSPKSTPTPTTEHESGTTNTSPAPTHQCHIERQLPSTGHHSNHCIRPILTMEPFSPARILMARQLTIITSDDRTSLKYTSLPTLITMRLKKNCHSRNSTRSKSPPEG